jgi:hypothetical protein
MWVSQLLTQAPGDPQESASSMSGDIGSVCNPDLDNASYFPEGTCR